MALHSGFAFWHCILALHSGLAFWPCVLTLYYFLTFYHGLSSLTRFQMFFGLTENLKSVYNLNFNPIFWWKQTTQKIFQLLPFFPLFCNFAFLDNRYNPARFFSRFSVRRFFICSWVHIIELHFLKLGLFFTIFQKAFIQ